MEYESEELFESIRQKTTQAKLKGKVPPEKIWMGIYYSREIEQKRQAPIEVRKVDDEVGDGVFAAKRIAPCAFVGEYTGVIQERTPKELKNERYCLRLTTWEMGKRNFCINASQKGNFTRFINHSANPNLALHSVYWKELPRMIFIALQEIPEGTQLTFDYGDIYWKEFSQPPKVL
jgi:SET domain-containing protein